MNLPNKITFLTEEQVFLMHEKCIEEFGGTKGLRDKNMFLSSLGQPSQTFDGRYLYDSIFLMAACYLFSFAKNHSFLDGNKRIALKASYHFLNLNGIDLLLNNNEFCDLILGCVEGRYNISHIAAVFEQNALFKSYEPKP